VLYILGYMQYSKAVLVSLCSLFSASILLATPSWLSLGGSFQGNPVGVRGYDGRLEVFVPGTDNALWFAAQTSPGGSWAPFVSLGGVIISNPAAAVDSTGRIAVFAVGGDSAVWTRAQISPGIDNFSDWTSIGGSTTTDLAVVQVNLLHAVPVAYVFMRGPDGALWSNRTNEVSGPWGTSWTSLGGYLASAPGAGVNVNGQATVFGRGGGDNALWYRQETAEGSLTFNDWATLGGAMSGRPAEVSGYVIYQGMDNAAWAIQDTTPFVRYGAPPTTWSSLVSLGGYITSNPTMSVDRQVYIVGADTALWTTTAAGGSWQSLGGSVVGDPFALLNQDGTDDVFAIGFDGTLWHIRQSSAGSWQ